MDFIIRKQHRIDIRKPSGLVGKDKFGEYFKIEGMDCSDCVYNPRFQEEKVTRKLGESPCSGCYTRIGHGRFYKKGIF